MKYELYIDVFILSNFCMDTLAFVLSGVFLGRKQPIRRVVLSSFVGTIAATASFLFLSDYILYVMAVHVIVNPLMIWMAFRPKSKREFFEDWLACYLVMLLSGGIMQWLSVTVFAGEQTGLCVLLTFVIGILAALLWEKQTVIGKRTYDVRLQIGQNTVDLKAYYDTGNLLTDPYFDLPVHIAAGERIQEYLSLNQVPGRLVSFSSLGEKDGWIKAYTIDEMVIYQKKGILQVKPAVVGVTSEQLFQHGDYQMILNGRLHIKG